MLAEAPAPSPSWPCRYGKVVPGSAAEEELVKQHLPLVKTVVGRLTMSLPLHVDIDDLHSAGLVGLLNAVRQYNPRSGASFETYARVRIRGAVFDELRRLDWVPRSIHAKARKVEAVMRKLEQAKGQLPTSAEMARALKMSLSDYEQLLEEVRPACFVSLDSAQNVDGEPGAPTHEAITDETQENPVEGVGKRELARLIAERLEQLPEMQRKVLALYYFEDLRLREIAEVFGLTESRICQIHAQAILAIRAYLRTVESPAA
jgi:RNA polymerase sigma factor for flagellar operon FliA